MPDAVIYVRYSPRPTKQGEEERKAANEDEESIKCQVEECRRYCEHKGLNIIRVLKDPETSARKMRLFDRPEGGELQDLKKGTHIVALAIDRVFRETTDGLLSMRYFADHEISLHFANQGGNSIDTSTAVGELIFTVLLGYASFEPRLIAERTKRGMLHRQANGQLMGHPEKVKYGCRFDKRTNRIVPDEAERIAMQRAVDLRDQGYTLASIGQELVSACLVRNGKWAGYRYSVTRILNRAKEAGMTPTKKENQTC